MNHTLKKEQITNKTYRSNLLNQIETEIKKQRKTLAPYTQERLQNTIQVQVQNIHQNLLDQRKKEQKRKKSQRLIDFSAPLCCFLLTLLAFWLVWGA